MKIGILFQDIKNTNIVWQKHQDIYVKTAKRAVEMADALSKMGYSTMIFSSLEDFFRKKYYKLVDLVFPCIECCFERNSNGFVSALLQMNNIPFIGNDAYINTIVSDKYLFKNIAHTLKIPTPKSKIIYNLDYSQGLSESIDEIKMPCVLKYRYGSMSYHTQKISDYKNFKEYINFMLKQNNGPILCEEYIEGHELSVPVIGTTPNEQILSVIEYTDSEKRPLEIYDSFWKIENDNNVNLHKLNYSSPSIQNIIKYVHRLYEYLNFHDYARFDFRLDNQGHPFLLEGNPLPALSYESAFDPCSYGNEPSFEIILSKIVASAIKRYNIT